MPGSSLSPIRKDGNEQNVGKENPLKINFEFKLKPKSSAGPVACKKLICRAKNKHVGGKSKDQMRRGGLFGTGERNLISGGHSGKEVEKRWQWIDDAWNTRASAVPERVF
jgi:hypothetical protein